jgi:hypothetical protein
VTREREGSRERPCEEAVAAFEQLDSPCARELCDRSPAAARHVLACADCAARFAELVETYALLSEEDARRGVLPAGAADEASGREREVWFVRLVRSLPMGATAGMAAGAALLLLLNYGLLAVDRSPGRNAIDSRLCMFLALAVPWVLFGATFMFQWHERARRALPPAVRARHAGVLPAAWALRPALLVPLTLLGLVLEVALAWAVGDRLARALQLRGEDALNLVLLAENLLLWVLAAPATYMAVRNVLLLSRMLRAMDLDLLDPTRQQEGLSLMSRGSSFILGWPLLLMLMVGSAAEPWQLASSFAVSLAVVAAVLGLPVLLQAEAIARRKRAALAHAAQAAPAQRATLDRIRAISPWLVPRTQIAWWAALYLVGSFAGLWLSWVCSALGPGGLGPTGAS